MGKDRKMMMNTFLGSGHVLDGLFYSGGVAAIERL
jgi:hypothetical protein